LVSTESTQVMKHVFEVIGLIVKIPRDVARVVLEERERDREGKKVRETAKKIRIKKRERERERRTHVRQITTIDAYQL
jgi:hypothetical protein